MRFAFQTVIWGRRIHDVELVLDIIAACGYQGVEFAQRPEQICVCDPGSREGDRPVRDINELLDLLRAKGRTLALVGLAGGTLRERMDFCGPDFRPEYLYIEDWDAEAEEAVCATNPFRLALHPHWFKKVQRQAQAQAILEKYVREHPKDPDSRLLGFLPDAAHLYIAGDDPTQAIASFRGRLAGVHLKDWSPSYGRYSHRYAHGFVSLGDGVVDVEGVLRQLEQIRFAGWVVVEQDATDTTPGHSAMRCAEWLAERGRIAKPDSDRVRNLLTRETAVVARATTTDAATRELDLLRALLTATSRGHAEYYQAVVEAFHGLGALTAVKLYTYSARNDELYLLAAAGLPDLQFKKILKAQGSLCGRATREQRVHDLDLNEASNARLFGDDHFLANLPAKRMITVPIFNPSNAHDLRHLLNLFPSGRDFWGQARELENLVAHVAVLGDHVTDNICSAVGAQTSHECSDSSTKDDFLRKLVALVQTAFHVEGVSIFLVSEVGSGLELGATTGIQWAGQLKPHEHFYPKGHGLTGATWAQREVRLITDARSQPDTQRLCWEIGITPGRDECLFAPLGRLGADVVGVIRLINKRGIPDSRAATMFTDDDVAVLDSIIQAAIPHLELLQAQETQLHALTRITHELQVPLVAIRGAVDFMRRALDEKGEKPKEFFGEDYLSDVLDWSLLMGRLVHNSKVFATAPGKLDLQRTRTFLKADVVAPAVKQVHPLLRERNLSPSAIVYGDFAELPPLYIDRNQFQQVFFNLLSNSIKYSERGNFRVRIDGGCIGSTYTIWFEDWGQGIGDGMEEMIFHPGFREKQAIRTDATGQGIGLTVVRAIVEAHGGTVSVTNLYKPTKFEIVLPMDLRRQPTPSGPAAGRRAYQDVRRLYQTGSRRQWPK